MTNDIDTLRHESAAGADYEQEMTSRIGPILLVSILFLLIASIVAGFWIVSLPSRALANLQQKAQQAGFELSAASSQTLFSDGAGVRFNDVTLTHDNGAITGKIAHIEMTGALPWSTPQVALQQPDMLIRVPLNANSASKSALGEASLQGLGSLRLIDGQLRVVDQSNTVLLAATSISATQTQTGESTQYKGTAGINGVRTTFRFELDDAERMMTDGTPVDLFITSPGATETVDVQFSGRMRLNQNFSLDGRFSSAASDAKLVFALLRLPDAIPVSGPLAAESGVSITSKGVSLNDLTLTQGDAEAKGRFSLAFGQDHNTFDGALALPRLSVATIDPAASWPERALDIPTFTHVRGKVDVNAQSLVFGTWSADQPKLTLSTDGVTTSLAMQAGKDENQIEATVSTTHENASHVFSAAAKLSAADAAPLLEGLTGTAFATGPAKADINLKASGRNLAEMMSKASGTIAFDLNRATLQGEGVQQIFAGSTAEKTASLQITADVNDGLAVLNVKPAKLASKTYTIKGEVDLLRKALALDITSQGGKRWGIAGPWIKPNIGADSAGAPEPAPAANQAATDSN
jgi:hypothetical protein